MNRVSLALVLALAACGAPPAAPDAAPAPSAAHDEPEQPSGDPRAAGGASAVERDEPVPPPPPPGQIDPRDQHTLGNEIETARVSDPDEIDRRYAAVRRGWVNRRYRWEMNVVGTFCREGACTVLPYDYARAGFRGGGSYMPLLRTTAESHRRITELCRPFANCVVRFEGVLSRFDLSTFEATHLELTDVNVLGARAARPNERWLRPVNVPAGLVRMARELPDGGAIQIRPTSTGHQRLEALVQRVHGRTDAGTGAAPTPPSGTTPATQSSTPRVGP